jgi:hypothetical protein
VFPDSEVWKLACELARSGDYENIVTIERELRRRKLLVRGTVTHNTYWREYLTRLCHTSRDGGAIFVNYQWRDPAIRAAQSPSGTWRNGRERSGIDPS